MRKQISVLSEEKSSKEYTIIKHRRGKTREISGTLEYLIDYFKYTLETGKAYEREKGNKKINLNPRGIKALVTNINNAKNNAASNGYSGEYYELKESFDFDGVDDSLDNQRVLERASQEEINKFKSELASNEVYKKAVQITKKYGYMVSGLPYYEESSGNIVFNISTTVKRMQPNIYFRGNTFLDDENFGEFEIQTVSYGSLSLDEYSKLIEYCNNAYNMCKELSKLDFTKLPVRD